jgi:acyl-CoA thioesterase FadM
VWQKGIKLITVNASIEYKHECFLFDEIAIDVKVANLKRMSLEIIFAYSNKKTGQLMAIGRQRIAFADP